MTDAEYRLIGERSRLRGYTSEEDWDRLADMQERPPDPWDDGIDFGPDDWEDALYGPEPCPCDECMGLGELYDYEDEDLEELYTDQHAARRDGKRSHITGMQVSNRSLKTVVLPMIGKRASGPRKGH